MGEVISCEKEFERTNERRMLVRDALEHVKRRLPIAVDVDFSNTAEDF